MATYVLINIIMALVIDVYTSIEDKMYDEKKDKKAIIKFGKAAFQEENKVKKALTLATVVRAFTSAGRQKASNSLKSPAPPPLDDILETVNSEKEHDDGATEKTVEAGQAFKSLLNKKKKKVQVIVPKKNINDSFEDED